MRLFLESPEHINRRRKAVGMWLLAGVVMIVLQILLGGITRLTGSGLSITEWNPLFGFLPPLNTAQWQESFYQYQQIAQFKYLNSHFTLEEYKSIFFWEWLHRVWARLLGIVFLIGFVYFLVRRYFDKGMIIPFVILFLLGAAQGLVGWIMVMSGLNNTNVHVSHIRLALHFVAALLLLAYTLWFALHLMLGPEKRTPNAAQKRITWILFFLLLVQLAYGAFMAGLKAGMAAPTWPTINGDWIPDVIGKSWINHPIMVHLIHRTMAYVLVLFTFFATLRAARLTKAAGVWRSAYIWPLAIVMLQLFLGIFTVLSAPQQVPGEFGIYEWLALLHQAVAMIFLMALIVHLYLYSSKNVNART